MKTTKLTRQIFWGVTWLNAANAVSMGMGFLQQVILVRALGIDQYGALQIAIATFELAAILFDFNLYYSAVRYGGEAVGRGDIDKYERVFSAALQIKLALSIALLLLSCACWLAGATYAGQRLGVPFMLLAATYVCANLLGYASTIYSTGKRFSAVSLQNALVAILCGCGMIAGAIIHGTVVGVLLGQFLANAGAAVVTLYVVRKSIYVRRLDLPLAREIIVYASQVAVSGVMKRILGKTDMLIVGYFLGAKDAGLYRIAQSVSPSAGATRR